jgi:hypothetical protein
VDLKTVESWEGEFSPLYNNRASIRYLTESPLTTGPASHTVSSSHSGDTLLFLPLRRSHPRYSVQKIASYHYGGKNFLTLTLDLGLGGMKVKTHDHLAEDERLNFKLVLGQDSVWLKGRIVYSQFLTDKQCVSGIEFIDISEGDRFALADYLGSLRTWLEQENPGLLDKG